MMFGTGIAMIQRARMQHAADVATRREGMDTMSREWLAVGMAMMVTLASTADMARAQDRRESPDAFLDLTFIGPSQSASSPRISTAGGASKSAVDFRWTPQGF